MRQWAILFTIAIFGTGCTHTVLERRTVKQASTLTDLQHQQVLDNLAAVACNPETLPWHVKVKGGLVQITDQGSGGFGADIASAAGGEVTRLLPAASAERGVVGQWELDPTTEPEELELLRLAYRKATDPANPEVNDAILMAIGELCVRFDILPKPKTLGQILTTNKAAEKIAGRLGEIERQISQTHLELAMLLPPPKNEGEPEEVIKARNEVAKAREGVAKAQEAVEAAKSQPQHEQKNALAALTQAQETLAAAYGKLAKVEEALGNVAKRKSHLSDKLEQLRSEQTGLAEMLILVTKPVTYTSTGQQGYGGVSPTIKIPESNPLRIQAVQLEQLLGVDNKKEKPADQKTLLLAAISFALDSYVPSAELREATQRNVGLVAQAEDKVRKLEDLVEKFNAPWLTCGKKHLVPKCACYVGRHRGCTGDCHVWVMPDQLGTLREFTLIVLALAPIEKQELFPSRGAAFSPSLR